MKKEISILQILFFLFFSPVILGCVLLYWAIIVLIALVVFIVQLAMGKVKINPEKETPQAAYSNRR